MDNERKIPEFELEPQSEFAKKFENFWYYNKWKVIFGIFIIFVAVVCIVQFVTREDYDVSVLYGGAFRASDTRVPDMQDSLSAIRSENDKDGVGINIIEIYGEDYVKEHPEVNTANNSSNYDTLCQLITTGEFSVLILDKWIYDEIKNSMGLRKVSEVCSENGPDADAMYDEYAVYFKKTDFYNRYSSTFGGLSEDCVICLCIYSPYKSLVNCSGSSDSDYEESVKYFNEILTYKK